MRRKITRFFKRASSEDESPSTPNVTILDDGTVLVTQAPLFWSCRLTLSICVFFGTMNLMMMRSNMSFAVVCMVRGSGVANDTFKAAIMEKEFYSAAVSEQYDWDKDIVGRVLAAYFYGYIIPQAFGGWFADQFGGKKPFVGGMVVQGFITYLIPVAASIDYRFLIAMRAIQGFSCGTIVPSFNVMYSYWAGPRERTALMGWAFLGFSVGSMTSMTLSGFLCQYGFAGGWPSIFYVFGTFDILCCICFWFLVYDTPLLHPRISKEEKYYLTNLTLSDITVRPKLPWKQILKSSPVYAYTFAHFAFVWSTYVTGLLGPSYLNEVLKFSAEWNGTFNAVPFFTMIVFRIICVTLFNKIMSLTKLSLTNYRKMNVMIGSIVSSTCFVILGQVTVEHRIWAVVLMSIKETATDLTAVIGFVFSYIDLAPRFSGLLFGISNCIGQSAGAILPSVSNKITTDGTREQWAIVWYITATLVLLSSITYVIFGSSELQPWAKFDTDARTSLIVTRKERIHSAAQDNEQQQ